MKIGEAFSAIDWSTEIPLAFKFAVSAVVTLNFYSKWFDPDMLASLTGLLLASGLWITRTAKPVPEPAYPTEAKK